MEGRRLAVAWTSPAGLLGLRVYVLGSGAPVLLTTVVDDGDLDAWCTLGPDTLLCAWNRAGTSHLELRDVNSQRSTALPRPDDVVLQLEGSSRAGVVAHAGGPQAPSACWLLDWPTRSWRRLSSDDRDRSARVGSAPRRIELRADDGLHLDAWWYEGKGWRTGEPAIVAFHGGPEDEARPLFNPTFQALQLGGFSVLAPNVRGSSGRGRSFAALDDLYGRAESFRDIRACVEWLRDKGVGSVGAFGVSYGAFLALHAAADHGVGSVALLSGIMDLETFLEECSPSMAWRSRNEYGVLPQDREFLRSLSPIPAVMEREVDVLLVHGLRDTNVPPSQSEQLASLLRRGGSVCELLLFEDEGHGIHGAENQVLFNSRVLRWFEETLR